MSRSELINQLYENYFDYQIDKEIIEKIVSKLDFNNEEDAEKQITIASLKVEQYIANEIKNKNSIIKEIVKSKFEYIKVFIKRTNKMLDDEQIDKIYDASIDKSCRQYDSTKMLYVNILNCAKKLSKDLFFIENLNKNNEKKIISPKKEEPIMQSDIVKQEEPIIQVDTNEKDEKSLPYQKKLTNQPRNLTIMNEYIKVYNMKKTTLCGLLKVNKNQLESILIGDLPIADYKLVNLYNAFHAKDYIDFINIIREKIEKREKILESQNENKLEETTIKERKVKINIYKDFFKSISDSDLERICNELGYKKYYFKRMLINGDASIKESEFNKILDVLNMSEDDLKEKQEYILKSLNEQNKENDKVEKNDSNKTKNDEKVPIYQYRPYFNSLSEEKKDKMASAIDFKYSSFYSMFLSKKRFLPKTKFNKILEILEFDNEEQLKEETEKLIEESKIQIYQYKPYFNSLLDKEKDKIESAIDMKYSSFYVYYLNNKRFLSETKFNKILEVLGFENEEQLKQANEKSIEETKIQIYQYRPYFNSLLDEEKDKIESAMNLKYSSFYNMFLGKKILISKIKFNKILEVLGFENEEQLKEANEKLIEESKIPIYQYRPYFNSLSNKEKDKIESAIDMKYRSFYTSYLNKKRFLSKTKFNKILETLEIENEEQLKELNKKFIEDTKIQIYQYKPYFHNLKKEEKNKIESVMDLKYSSFYNMFLGKKNLISKMKFDKILEVLGFENEDELKEANKKLIESPNVAIYEYKNYFKSLTIEEKNKIESAINIKYKSFFTMHLSKKILILKTKFDKILEVLGFENEDELKEANKKLIEGKISEIKKEDKKDEICENVSNNELIVSKYKDYILALSLEEQYKLANNLGMDLRVFKIRYLNTFKPLKNEKLKTFLETLGFNTVEQLDNAVNNIENVKPSLPKKISISKYKDYILSLPNDVKDKMAVETNGMFFDSFYRKYLETEEAGLNNNQLNKLLKSIDLQSIEELDEELNKIVKERNLDEKEGIYLYKYREYLLSLGIDVLEEIAKKLDFENASVFRKKYINSENLLGGKKVKILFEILGINSVQELESRHKKYISQNKLTEEQVYMYEFKDYIYSLPQEITDKIASKFNMTFSAFKKIYCIEKYYMSKDKFELFLNIVGLKNIDELRDKLKVSSESQNIISNNYSELFNLIQGEVNREVLLQLIETKFDKEDTLIANLLLGGYKERYYSPDAISNFLNIKKEYVFYIFRRCLEEYKLLCNKVSGVDKSKIDDLLKKTYEIEEE